MATIAKVKSPQNLMKGDTPVWPTNGLPTCQWQPYLLPLIACHGQLFRHCLRPALFSLAAFAKFCEAGDQPVASAYVFFVFCLFSPEHRRLGQAHQGIPA